ncbi:hypothetical protein, partial [Bifidobacterium pseudocatenulatum]|uniref:hypothetical protein n=1 Tax=Bifidobacterium pseudocatenulatum TaxID=28026 RepID=UPI001ED9E6DF
DLEAYLIDGECKVGDVVFANLELGKTAKMIRVVTEVLPNDEFTTEYLVELDTMEDAVLVDTLDVGTTFTNRTTNWKGV